MKVVSLTNRILKSRVLLNGLEKISEHGTSFSAGTSLVLSGLLRPGAIYITPKADKENKQYAMSNSICSALVKFSIVEAVALPLENAIKYIDNNPQKFLSSQTFKTLSPRAYKLLTQMIKLSAGMITAIPKSILTIALVPVLMDKIFNVKIKNERNQITENNKLSFTGNLQNKLSSGLAKIIENKKFQHWAVKNELKDRDIAKHITAGTDVLLTASSVFSVQLNKDIKKERKRALNLNNIISTAITIGLGYGIDRVLKPSNDKFIEKFSLLHANNPKLPKYIEGINILRPAIIFASIYYGFLPVISTFTSDKLDKYLSNHMDK